jgi:hypothetical protein
MILRPSSDDLGALHIGADRPISSRQRGIWGHTRDQTRRNMAGRRRRGHSGESQRIKKGAWEVSMSGADDLLDPLAARWAVAVQDDLKRPLLFSVLSAIAPLRWVE